MPENSKQKEGIESEHDAEEPEIKKGSNWGVMPENPKQNEGIESRRDAGEPETKQRDRIRA